jgi:hypothetical protein
MQFIAAHQHAYRTGEQLMFSRTETIPNLKWRTMKVKEEFIIYTKK